ncbi:MAG: 4-hydroxy-tetrahydrodipicolinate reductase [Lachnospirales bacterium]
MINIIVHGVSGTMGRTVVKLCEENEDVHVVAGVDPVYKGREFTFPVFETLANCDVHGDCIIDFSTASAIEQLLKDAMEMNIPVVLCTTGLTEEVEDLVQEVSGKIAIFKSANMSLGVNLMLDLLKKATSILYNADFDIEIIEKHHNKKIDSPSGTALLLANTIENEIDENMKYIYDRSSVFQKREKNEIGIHGVRGGTIVGEHTAIFAGQDEVIEITHRAQSKNVFAVGSINAAIFVSKKNKGIFDMYDLIREA